MKKAFSLLELIFAIVILGIIASFAIPKYANTKDNALASTIKRDIITVITSIQSYSMMNKEIENISDTISINKTNWTLSAKKMVFKDDEKDCVTITVDDSKLTIVIDKSSGDVCKLLDEMGIEGETFEL